MPKTTPEAWHAVKHPAIKGVTTYWRDYDEADEHRARLAIKYGKCDPVKTVKEIPYVLMG